MKKKIILTLCIVLLLSISACSDDNSSQYQGNPDSTASLGDTGASSSGDTSSSSGQDTTSSGDTQTTSSGGNDTGNTTDTSTLDGDSNGDGVDTPICLSGLVDCNGTCVDTNLDPNNCGGCAVDDPAHQCPSEPFSTAVCSSGTCDLVCTTGYTDCDLDLGTDGNGCEINTTSDVDNCGGCGILCQTLDNTTQSCMGSTCIYMCTDPHLDCNGDLIDPETSNGCEFDSSAIPLFPGEVLPIPDVLNVDYESSITLSGFASGQTLNDVNNFLGLCVTMEHSWLRDLQIEFDCPSGATIMLQAFRGRTGGEIHMGEPIDNDGSNPTPGVGYEYCWTPTATQGPSMTEWADINLVGNTLPPGDYQTSDPYTNLEGCELNGVWTIRVIDDWPSDNGFIFGWSLAFAPAILPACFDVVSQ